MAWREPTPFELELLADARQRWVDILPLALHLFLAPRVEPLLLRNTRRQFTPQVPTEGESLLWFSPLVAARNTREIVFHLGVAKALADEFMQQEDAQARLDALWQFTRRHTRHWSAEDRLERDLRYHALRGDDAELDAQLRILLRSIHREADEQKRIELSRLVKRSLPVIAPAAAGLEEARWLAQYAAIALGDAGAWADPGPPRLPPPWLAARLPAPLRESPLGIEIRHDPTQGQVLHFIPAQHDATSLVFKQPLPARLHVAPEGRTGEWHSVAVGSRIAIRPPSPHLRLSTLEGAQWDLRTDGLTDVPPNATPSDRPTLWLAHVEADRELAEAIARWLRGQDIEVKLLPESPQSDSAHEEVGTACVLRLWTGAARRYWADRPDHDAEQGGVLLRAEEVDLPAGGAPGGLLDWRDWQRLMDSPEAARLLEPLKQWLESGELPPGQPPSKLRIDSDEIEALLKEIQNPNTTPPRRLNIGDRLAELGDPREGVGVVEIEVAEDDEALETAAEPLNDAGYGQEIDALLAEIADAAIKPPRRLEIGDRLAELGDPRPGVGLDAHGLPDIDWVEIPSGSFIYQKGETRELPNFWIARYPVTNLQYQAFIDDGGYREERWWRDLNRPEPKQSRWPQPNRPRTDVDWHEAVAFGRWFCARLGLEEGSVRLPTEEEWEKAARGPDGRVYPWGGEYRPGFANVDETLGEAGERIPGQPTAVGLYPHGRSLYEVEDLAGTVWEWCLNEYDEPRETGLDSSGGRRVLRGGSWDFHPDNARADLLNLVPPVFRDDDVGFRLLSVVPIASAGRPTHAVSGSETNRGRNQQTTTEETEEITMFEDHVAFDDEHSFGGQWTLTKLQALEKYLKAFNQALSRQGFTRVYIDAFAGTGSVTVKSGEGNAVTDGSARRALKVEPAFHRYCFIELQARKVAALTELAREFPDKSILIIQDDANVALRELCRKYNWRDTRAVLFLDPFGLHVDWPTLEAIAATKAIDVWYLFPYSGLYRQMARKADAIDSDKAAAITRILGTEEWHQRFLAPPRQSELFGHKASDEREGNHVELLEFVSERLGRLFPAVTKPKVLYQGGDSRTPKGAPLFALYFAAANPDPKAFGLATKIAQDVLNAL